MIPKSSRPSDDVFDDTVDGLDPSERDFYIAIIQDAIQMVSNQCHKLFQRFEALPPQLLLPTLQELQRPGTPAVEPQGTEYFFQIIGDTEAFVDRERFLKQPFLLCGQIEPPAQEKPTLYEVKDGSPNLINFDLRNGVYVVPKILDSGYLVIGKHRMDFKRQE